MITRKGRQLFGILAITALLAPVVHAQSFLTNGLVAYFPFNGNATDASGNGHNGTLLGAAGFGVDRFGNFGSSLALPGGPGIGSGVDVPSLTAFSYLPVTYSAWILISNYPPPPSGTIVCMTLLGREQCGDQSSGALAVYSDPNVGVTNVINYFSGSTGRYVASYVPPTNQWIHLAFTLDASDNANFYVNGVDMPSAGSAPAGQPVDFRIGASSGSGSGCGYEYVWNGLIDDVRIYNRALSASEIEQLYGYEAPPCAGNLNVTAMAMVTNGFVIAADVTDGGCGISNAPLVAFQGGGGSGAAAVAVVSNGFVQEIHVTDAGSNYTSAPAVVIGYSPSITNQPVSVTTDADSAATFSVGAIGTTLMNYQWLFDGSNIAGATSSVLVITNVVQTNLGTYSVVVSNAFGSVTSSNAVLAMYPFLEQNFGGLDTFWGYTNTLSVTAWGTGPLSYQWYDNGNAISGATDSTLAYDGIQFTNGGVYTVVVSSSLGSVTNPLEEVVVNPAGISLGLYPGVTISGVVGYSYVIQKTPSLGDTNSWVTVGNVTLTEPVQLWVDTNLNASLPQNPQQYYRILPGQ